MDSHTSSPSSAPPSRLCDLVMEGGITSGVVYPLAICELSREFRFKNIGGASAGAIAAAAAAAAELGRSRNTGGAFDMLSTLPHELVEIPTGEKRTRLFSFFQPQRNTRRVFETCVAALGGGYMAPVQVVLAAIKNFWLAFIAGAIPGLLLIWSISLQPVGTLSALALMVAIAAAVLGALLVTASAFFVIAVRQIRRNFFGLASGMQGSQRSPAQALTPWLTQYLNRLAGLDPQDRPLTFGDLWGGSADPLINLEMVTTCLTHGRPYRLPLRDDENIRENRQFFYKRADFERLFPEQVIAWMEQRPRRPDDDKAERERKFLEEGFIPLPEPSDLPVVVAVRMSLRVRFKSRSPV